jgi:hypothetical protein
MKRLSILFAFAFITPGLAFAEDDEDDQDDHLSISPDKRFVIRKSLDDDLGPYFQVLERKSGKVVLRIPTEGGTGFINEARFVWAPDSRRLAWNYRAGGRYYSTSLFQWNNGKFVELKSPEDGIGYQRVETERLKLLKKAGLPADIYQRRIWDTWSIRAWSDADTPQLIVHSIRSVQIPKTEDSTDLDVWLRYTLKIAESGQWKVIKLRVLTEKEAKSAPQE